MILDVLSATSSTVYSFELQATRYLCLPAKSDGLGACILYNTCKRCACYESVIKDLEFNTLLIVNTFIKKAYRRGTARNRLGGIFSY
jgi:hypothetical protein